MSLKLIYFYITLVPHWILLNSDINAKILFKKDIFAYISHFKLGYTVLNYCTFVNVLAKSKEVRTVLYIRLSKIARKYHITSILICLVPKCNDFHSGTNSENIGGGMLIMHSWSTVVRAEKIGDNFTVFQNVTIGGTYKPGVPTIGNNVTIWAGAVVCGKIVVGDNVIIGPNAVVFKDVPNNTTIVSALSYELKKK